MSEEKLVILDFLREDVLIFNVEFFKKFLRLVWLYVVFVIYVELLIKWEVRVLVESEKEKGVSKVWVEREGSMWNGSSMGEWESKWIREML